VPPLEPAGARLAAWTGLSGSDRRIEVGTPGRLDFAAALGDPAGAARARSRASCRSHDHAWVRDRDFDSPGAEIEVMSQSASVAYLSMEIGLDPGMPTYAGGLGVLAGDTLRSCADLGIDVVGVTLLHRRGHFHQSLDASGRQSEAAVEWKVETFAEPIDARVHVEIEGRKVEIAAWRYRVRGQGGAEVPVLLLDTDLPSNDPVDRRLTDVLYGGDKRYRLCQETVLGMGGVRMLRAIGHGEIRRFHLNEGHASLAILALLEERALADTKASAAALLKGLRSRCIFTTHTPIPAGHDVFTGELVRSVLGERAVRTLAQIGLDDGLNMTQLALRGSAFVNGVALRHAEVSRAMFPDHPIRSITNGVHADTWAAPSFRALFDQHIPEWRADPLTLRNAIAIPLSEIEWARERAKRALLDLVRSATGETLEPDALTLGFARRATGYKRATLVFHDVERLIAVASSAGPVQIVFGGRAHPADFEGKAMIEQVFRSARALRGKIRIAYVPNYDMASAKLICSGCDVWLNTPVPPLEASGTSGMKAALNGVPSLSVLDGWWIEGHVEGVTGWAIGGDPAAATPAPGPELDRVHAASLYDQLERAVIPCFYRDRAHYLEMARSAIALNASFFNSHRMVLQYLHAAYLTPDAPAPTFTLKR
jgi:glycogen phosphorylase